MVVFFFPPPLSPPFPLMKKIWVTATDRGDGIRTYLSQGFPSHHYDILLLSKAPSSSCYADPPLGALLFGDWSSALPLRFFEISRRFRRQFDSALAWTFFSIPSVLLSSTSQRFQSKNGRQLSPSRIPSLQ